MYIMHDYPLLSEDNHVLFVYSCIFLQKILGKTSMQFNEIDVYCLFFLFF